MFNDSCPICLDESIINLIVLECKHGYCQECIDKCVANGNEFIECPLCRKCVHSPSVYNSKPAKDYSWVDKIGKCAFPGIDLNIGGCLIDKLYGAYLDEWLDLSNAVHKQKDDKSELKKSYKYKNKELKKNMQKYCNKNSYRKH